MNEIIATTDTKTVTINPTDGSCNTIASGMVAPHGIAQDNAGNIYIADSSTGDITQITNLGKINKIISGFDSPTGLAFDDVTNRLFVSEAASDKISTINLNSKDICADVITFAKNPVTGEWGAFPTPCDVPLRWVTSNNDPSWYQGAEDEPNIAYDAIGNCGAYVAPSVWKQFDCYNLAAIGKTTGDDPFTPSWRLIGGYWQWGRKGPNPSQWYDTNTEHFAHGPTGPGSGKANSGDISGWDQTDVPDGAWSDSVKTANDPCPDEFRVPTRTQWEGVLDNNNLSTVGTWSSYLGDPVNYSAAWFFGSELMLPAAGRRAYGTGALGYRGYFGDYWSSSGYNGSDAWHLYLNSGYADTHYDSYRWYGHSVRCVAE